MSGNTNETGDVGESPGKSSLFFLTTITQKLDLGIGLPGDKVEWLAEQYLFMYCPVRSRRPVKTQWSDLFARLVVLITASGLQGAQPLVDRIM